MKTIIRWKGLATGVVIVTTLAVVSFLFLDTVLRYVAISTMQKITGAEVNLVRVQHSFTPLSISLQGLQLTDPKTPKNDMVKVNDAKFSLDLLPALTGKLHITELVVDGMSFNQERDNVGQVFVVPETTEEQTSETAAPAWLNSKDVDVDSIIANAPLKTPKALAHLDAVKDKHQAQIKQKTDALPKQQQIDQLKRDIESLQNQKFKTPQDFLAAKQKLQSIKDRLKQHNQSIKDLKTAAKIAKQELQPALTAVKNAPEEDYQQVSGLVSGDSEAISNLAQQVFGDSADSWIEPVMMAIKHIAPMLEKSQTEQQQDEIQNGYFVSFGETSPQLLIKHANINMLWQGQKILSEWHDITHQHAITKRPTRYQVSSQDTPYWRSIALNGEFRLIGQELQSKQSWDVSQLDIKAFKGDASNNNTADSFNIANAMVNGSGQLSVLKGQLDGDGKWLLSDVIMQSNSSNKVVSAIISGVNSKGKITLSNGFSGDWHTPKVSLRSDLDRILGDIVSQQYTGKAKQKLSDWKQKLGLQANTDVNSVNGLLTDLKTQLTNSDSIKAKIEDLLGSELTQGVDSESLEDKLKDKLKSKLFGG